MNVARTFEARLKALTKEKVNPVLVIPVLDTMEEILIGLQQDIMVDKNIPSDEKGRLAQTLTPLLIGVREFRQKLHSVKERGEIVPQKRLNNAHIT